MSSMQEQPQSRGEYYDAPVSDSPARSHGGPGGGTSVVGQPTDPSHQGSAGRPVQDSGEAFPPSAQMPGQAISAAQQPPPAGDGSHPYVQTQDIPGGASRTPMDSIMQVVNKWGKKAEDMTGNVWGHLRTGPNVADTAFGRIAVITKSFSEGGMENVYRQTFDVAPDEHLLKSYASYLSTSTGPVAGTLYISTHKVAFCSDRPLAMPGSPTPGQNQQGNQPSADKTAGATQQQQQQQQQQWVFYKLTVPISQLQSVEPKEDTQKKPPEKYILLKTVDGHDFWFMGFMNYDKGLKNLQEALASKQTSPPTGNMDPAEAAAMGRNSEGSTESTKVGYTPATSKTAGGTGTNTDGPYNAEAGNATASRATYPDPSENTTGPPPPYSSVN